MPPTIELRFDGTVRRGRVVDLPPDVAPSTVLDAIRDGNSDCPSVDCPQPHPVHEHVGHIHTEMGIRARTALARAGRSRGLTTEYDEQIANVEAEIERLGAKLDEMSETETAQFRKAVDERQAATAELREAVAAARGRLHACRENDLETDAAAERLETAISELAEHETAVAAARERLDRARSRRRERRNLEERRLQLEDRHANLQREARATLVETLREEFASAVEAVPGESTTDDPFDTSPVAVALAVARTAALEAPIVLDCDRFDSPRAASDWLEVPVLNV